MHSTCRTAHIVHEATKRRKAFSKVAEYCNAIRLGGEPSLAILYILYWSRLLITQTQVFLIIDKQKTLQVIDRIVLFDPCIGA